MFIKYLFILSAFIIVKNCNKTPNNQTIVKDDCFSPKLNDPTIYKLPFSLKEISGLAYNTPTNQWVCINDEKGNIYFLDNSFKFIKKIKFAKPGDYEGVEIVDDIIYVISSKGDIYRYNWKENKRLRTIKTKLSQKNDIEGLGYLPKTNSLIIACKGNPYIKKKKKSNKKKALYFLSLDTHKIDKSTRLLISDHSLTQFVEESMDCSQIDVKIKKRLHSFAPSAVAYDANNDLFYVLSSSGKLVVLVDHQENIRALELLGATHKQPEGIYLRNGNVIIANETSGLNALVYIYKNALTP